MRKKFIVSYFLIFAALLIMMSLSRHTSEKMRGQSVAFMAPLWEKILVFKHFILNPSQPSPFGRLTLEEDKQRLQLENQLLEIEISHLQKQLNEQLLISSQMTKIAAVQPEEGLYLAEDYQKSWKSTLNMMQKRIHAIPARVIFRSFDTWNSFLWINAGEAANRIGQTSTVAYNSPVIIGTAIVGIIDYVGEFQSRVRLISDSRLTPSVRAIRGGEQDFLIGEQIEKLMQQMKHKKNLPLSPDEQITLSQLLLKLKQNLMPFKKTWYLAKGELLGSVFSARLGQNVTLKGTGFNYDFADEEGESRDLRIGKFMSSQEQAMPILKVNDLLITTGMDGIFPAGFQVAIVTRVGLLKEGDYFYDLEAEPVAGPLEELALVFILPPTTQENFAKMP